MRKRGTNNDDLLKGLLESDYLYGDRGNDEIYAYDGDDYIRGGKGNDTLYGGPGNDILNGDKGDDILVYDGYGKDILTGGPGSDIFLIDFSRVPKGGVEKDIKITDFQIGEDKLQITGADVKIHSINKTHGNQTDGLYWLTVEPISLEGNTGYLRIDIGFEEVLYSNFDALQEGFMYNEDDFIL